MITNGKSIRGIFLYDKNLELEKGDFVVSGNSIYICTALYPTNQINKTVSGEDPSRNSRNFKIYPGEMISTKEEYDNYIKGKDDSDKFISSYVVSEVLQGLHHGLSITGVIEDYIEGEGTPLDDIMRAPVINNGTFYVSPEVTQLQDILPVIGPIDTDNTGNYNLVLRQYTYLGSKSEDGMTLDRFVRVQELINPYSGYTAYRYTTRDGETGDFGDIISTWRTSYTYSGEGDRVDEIVYRLRALESFYTTRMNQVSSELENLRGSFRFRELELSTYEGKNYFIPVLPNKLGIVTFTINAGGNLYRTFSYDFTSISGQTSVTRNIKVVEGTAYITISYNPSQYQHNFVHIILPDTYTMVDAYYREYYGS